MAKRYTVSKTVTLNQQDDANTLVFDEQIDMATLLSQRLQKNIRQGHVFHIHKMQVGLSPSGGDLDTGLSVAGTVRWAPATKNSVKGWNMAFNTWRRQKRLKINAVGLGVRYDDFEVAYNSDFIDSSRTSSLFTNGMNDDTSESVCIYGDSTEDDDVTLRDLYESAQPQALPSRFPIGNAVVKQPKFTDEFPNSLISNYGANWSTIADMDGVGVDSGAAYNADPVYFQDTASLCGVVIAKGYVIAEDTGVGIADSLTLQLNFTVSIGTPLHYKPTKRRSRRPYKLGMKRSGKRGRPKSKR